MTRSLYDLPLNAGAIERRIEQLQSRPLDDRADAETNELMELLLIAPLRLDPWPDVRRTPYGLQDTNGVDVTLIDEQLRKTPLERVRTNDAFARSIRHLREANGRRA